ncbi:molybdenum cofactor guanylyltransferase [Cytobacillus dafuensis]|uniref:Probable molybdenum cofactor guanylyltransferase n=1 Tax=Cytobacillus dafuensis TaxID=1742359 RepID=A0A5B8Z9H0_CYTDA|nr:molybdenum cofactor guanylyltransferase [Cytobacillus dafuensis]QED49782.1 molybdenum cofactor guanylyltransferase [Cytobacillus dafuensis]
MRTTGIIMAGGKSSRMGTNKALLKIEGKSVIEKIAAELKKSVSEIIIVTNTFEDYQSLGYPMVHDQWKGMGPLAGIHAGLEASHTDKNLVVACDMPFISSELGTILLTFLEDYQAAVPNISGQLHPLFAAYRKGVLKELDASLQKQELRIRQFLDKVNTKTVTEADLQEAEFHYRERHLFNMNHPVEFEEALKIENGHLE